MSLDQDCEYDTTKSRTKFLFCQNGTSATNFGAKIGLLSAIPASLVGTSVALMTTSTVTSVGALAGGLAAGAAAFCLCTGVGVAIGAGVGVAVGTVIGARQKRSREREETMLISRTGV